MLALLCAGQGTLSDKTFALVADQPAAESIFVAASAYLGEDPRKFIRTRDADELSANHASQILTVTSALAIYACVADLLVEQTAVTGYSVGEMAAWSIAGIWTADEALRLTDIRAQLMEDVAGPGGRLGYVRGLDRAVLERLLEKHRCQIAIENPGLLFVVGGAERDVSGLCDEAAKEGARTGLLAVKIASHTTRLAEACTPLQQALDAGKHSGIAGQRVLLAGGDGERIFSVAGATAKLANQVAHPIDWTATLEAVAELGATTVLDLGPGHALAEMMQAASGPLMRCYAADGFRTIEGLRRWVGSYCALP